MADSREDIRHETTEVEPRAESAHRPRRPSRTACRRAVHRARHIPGAVSPVARPLPRQRPLCSKRQTRISASAARVRERKAQGAGWRTDSGV